MKIIAVIIAIGVVFGIGSYIGTKQACGEECVAGASTRITSIPASEFNQELQQDEVTLLDIRTADEYQESHIAGAVQTDYYQTEEFSSFLDGLDKEKTYLIYCRSGNRSRSALEIMRRKGFTDVADLQGGINAWKAAGFAVEN